VVTHTLENVQNLVVGDLAVMVLVGLLVQSHERLPHSHALFLGSGHWLLAVLAFAAGWFFLLQHTLEQNTAATLGLFGVSPIFSSVGAKPVMRRRGVGVGDIVGHFGLRPAPETWRLATVGCVNGLLRQHGGDLVPH